MSTLTTFYNYSGGNESEFVFSCKGRPFTSLISSFLPTPSSTLIDYGLVKDLNLKITDLQCQKFHYGGHKMRILGHVTTAVQTIKNGFTSGNFQFSAKVVLDLNKNLDTFSIAGHKMSKQLSQGLPVAADQAQDDDTPAPVPANSPSRLSLPAVPFSDVDVVTTPKPKRSPIRPNKKASELHPLTPSRATIPS